jgi:hypothetical protein
MLALLLLGLAQWGKLGAVQPSQGEETHLLRSQIFPLKFALAAAFQPRPQILAACLTMVEQRLPTNLAAAAEPPGIRQMAVLEVQVVGLTVLARQAGEEVVVAGEGFTSLKG